MAQELILSPSAPPLPARAQRRLDRAAEPATRIDRRTSRRANLVSMTRKSPTQATASAKPLHGRWRLQDAKARFSELVRLAHSDGPQHATLHGHDAVVVTDADEFRRLKGGRSGQMPIDALQASPHRKIEVQPRRSAMPVRAVKL